MTGFAAVWTGPLAGSALGCGLPEGHPCAAASG